MSGTWTGSFKCDGDANSTAVMLTVTNTRSFAQLEGHVQVQGRTFNVTGSFASYLKSIALTSTSSNGQGVLGIELIGVLKTPLNLDDGVFIFISDQGRKVCPQLQLHRADGELSFQFCRDWCLY